MQSIAKRVGVGLRPKHYDQFMIKCPDSVSWVEVVSENYMNWKYHSATSSLDTLLKIRQNVPVALHGVSLSIGSTDSLDPIYLKELKNLIIMVEPLSISDHISWTGVGGKNSHDLLPMPFTKEAVTLLCERIDQVQNYLGRKIVLENISSYLEFAEQEMTEAEFIASIVKDSGCSLLLDVNNIFVNSINHGLDPVKYLHTMPIQSIEYVHLAGHKIENGLCIDTHGSPVCPEVWDIYRQVCTILPNNRAMIERDDNIPAWIELEKELINLREIQKEEYATIRTTAEV